METPSGWRSDRWCHPVRYQVPRYSGWKLSVLVRVKLPQRITSDTKYRDIADGNLIYITSYLFSRDVRYQVPRYSGWKHPRRRICFISAPKVRYQVPRYSGWKPLDPHDEGCSAKEVRYQVPRYSGWKHNL